LRRGNTTRGDVPPVYTEAYVANLRHELTRAQARLARAERERDAALAENARLREAVERTAGEH
jgi:hypothetical protein